MDAERPVFGSNAEHWSQFAKSGMVIRPNGCIMGKNVVK
jgi:hypothetical protein